MVPGVGGGGQSPGFVVGVCPACAFGVDGFGAAVSGGVVGVGYPVIFIGADFRLATESIIFVFRAVAVAVEFGFDPTVFGVFRSGVGVAADVSRGGVGIGDAIRPIDGVDGLAGGNGGDELLHLVGGIVGVDGFG